MSGRHLSLLGALMMFGLRPAAGVAAGPAPAGTPPVPNAASQVARVPMPPPARCPVEFFRELLVKTPAERIQSLTNRPVASQKLILAKLHEYDSLGAEERELRLRTTELHWYLVSSMSVPAPERAGQLALVPAELRQFVVSRLEVWDTLPPEARKRLLEPAARYLSTPPADPATLRTEVQGRISPARQLELEAGLRDWQNLSEAQRQQIASHFQEFLELTPQERKKTLATLSEPERRQIERTFEKFWELQPPQRVLCLRAFKRFATLTPADRQRFLENTELWEKMAPSERDTWKDLVYKFGNLPPLPPGLNSPPLPPRATLRLPVNPTVATNRN